jgi:DNA-directed RNA polymerase specialized sigma24 family protein
MCSASWRPLRRYVWSLTRRHVDAEDLAHDALLRAYEKRATFQTGGNLKVWLLSILHNVYVDGSRARHAEAQRLARASRIFRPGRTIMCASARFGRRSSSYPKSSARLSISSRLRA